MKFRIFSTIVASILFSPLASCQDKGDVQVTYQVEDEQGKPVENALVSMSYFDHWQPGEGFGKDVFKRVEKTTDAKGTAILAAASSRPDFGASITKEGFYAGTDGFDFRKAFKSGPDDIRPVPRNGRWEPWNPTVKIEFRRIVNPIPLVARKFPEPSEYAKIPAWDKQVGFDMEVSDWVAPYGKGKISDLIFQLSGQQRDPKEKTFDVRLKVSFSNPQDGFVVYRTDGKNGYSDLRLPHHAPKEGYQGVYQKRSAMLDRPLSKEEVELNKKIRAEGMEPLLPSLGRIDEDDPKENLFLRLRTKTNSKGEVTGAHYAKIYGGYGGSGAFAWFQNGFIHFQYYYNPTPNDTNLEFDPKRNLLKADYVPKPQRPAYPGATEEDKAMMKHGWESEETSRREKALEKVGGNIKEP